MNVSSFRGFKIKPLQKSVFLCSNKNHLSICYKIYWKKQPPILMNLLVKTCILFVKLKNVFCLLVNYNTLEFLGSPSSDKVFWNVKKFGAKSILQTIKQLMGDSGENFPVVLCAT